MDKIDSLIIERPLGSVGNAKVLAYLKSKIASMGYDLKTFPFECNYWEKRDSFLKIGEYEFIIEPCPFSNPYEGKGKIAVINDLEDLLTLDLKNRILLLKGNIVKEPLMPKDFPFYYPEEHKKIIDALLNSGACAIIAVTGKHPMSGLDPFPLFEDGNFSIPAAFTDELTGIRIEGLDDNAYLRIVSSVSKVKSEQIVAGTKSGQTDSGKIVVCAHMDTKYGTPGALDNAAGVMVMLEVMKNMTSYKGDTDIEFVPFNGEESYEVKGQLEYLDYTKKDSRPIKLVINIDSPGHNESNSAISLYNFSDEMENELIAEAMKNNKIELGQQWYAGDHAMFVFQGIPCIAVTSSNLFETVLYLTHTSEDTANKLDLDLIKITADFLTKILKYHVETKIPK